MEPIISPWMIYFLGQINNIFNAISLIAILSAICWAIVFLLKATATDLDLIINRKGMFLLKITCIISFLLWIFMPSQKTIIAMIIAENTTPVNIQKAIDTGKDFKETIKKDIIDLIRESKKGG